MSAMIRIGLWAGVLSLAADQASKFWLLYSFNIASRGAVALTPFFDLVLTWNRGISYGWFQTETATGEAFLLVVKLVAVAGLVFWLVRAQSRLAALSLGLIIGGAIGNAIDRLAYGAVVDFALFHLQIAGKSREWYVFNLADVAIVAGVVGLLYDSLFASSAAVKAP